MKKIKSTIVLCVLFTFNAYAQQDFSGHWFYATESSNFEIDVQQIGDSIKGSICAIIKNGDFIDCAMTDEDEDFISIRGVVVGNVATVEFWSSYANGWGKATITKISDTQMLWKIIEKPNTGVSFIPIESTLTN